ncbi:MAG: hypothetical protein GEU81_05195 [Nitriliruptorales bacterium]|nr:hypothetical protein [Nitriliruptorales bacterium]
MRMAVELWAPEYGSPIDGELEASTATIEVGIEVPADRWAPLAPRRAEPAKRVRFVDGVRRVDAGVWITGDEQLAWQGVAASYGAGVVRCEPASAQVETCAVRRGLFSAAPDLRPLRTRHGTYHPRAAAGGRGEDFVRAVQQRMLELEAEVAAEAGEADLVVVDGPLRKAPSVPGAVGYVKTHHTAYLPPAQAVVIGRLRPGERTPLFLTTTRWSRYSWYLRLPGGGSHAWAGVVRGEASGDLAPEEARRVADLVAATLPSYASSPAKDPRAPQNLHPVAHLERRLRHHLGDPALLYRSLTLAAARRASAA